MNNNEFLPHHEMYFSPFETQEVTENNFPSTLNFTKNCARTQYFRNRTC